MSCMLLAVKFTRHYTSIKSSGYTLLNPLGPDPGGRDAKSLDTNIALFLN